MTFTFTPDLRDRVSANLAEFKRYILSGEEYRQAAVALIITPPEKKDGDASMLLTRRTSKLNKHAGQWALPGGRVDDGETAYEAAIRETEEEVGLKLGSEHFLGQLDDLATKSNFIMQPFVFWLDDLSELAPNPDEVASVHYWPVSFFRDENAIQLIDQEEGHAPLLRLNWGSTRIHAPTGAVMLQLWEAGFLGQESRVNHYAHPNWAK